MLSIKVKNTMFCATDRSLTFVRDDRWVMFGMKDGVHRMTEGVNGMKGGLFGMTDGSLVG